jgi:hypothetical protein
MYAARQGDLEMLELLLAAEAQARGGHLIQVSYARDPLFLPAAS